MSPSITQDPVVQLGMQLRNHHEAWTHQDDQSSKSRESGLLSAGHYFEKAAEHQFDACLAIRELIANTKAASLLGAAIQVVEINRQFCDLWDRFPHMEGYEGYENQKSRRAIERMIYSILGVIDQNMPSRLSDVLYPDYVSKHVDPWAPVEQRCPDFTRSSAELDGGSK